jgi:hypothetical protein
LPSHDGATPLSPFQIRAFGEVESSVPERQPLALGRPPTTPGRTSVGSSTGIGGPNDLRGREMDELTEERIARNDAAFRFANERIEAVAIDHEMGGRLPFICECGNRACSEIVSLTIAEYEAVRVDSRRFFNVPGHQAADQGVGEVVERHGGYVVYEKHGHAGDVADRLDERSRAGDAQAEVGPQ